MDQGSHPNFRKNGLPKEVFKDIIVVSHKSRSGRDSPESGSLYSDYESGQQYEDKDLPSGYNSGEQYDTMSTGYTSGEAYELPEAREPAMEPTLAIIEEISLSNRSCEDVFILPNYNQAMQENNLLVQMENVEISSSSSSIPQTDEQLPVMVDTMTGHKMKRKKKDFQVVVPENAILHQTEKMESSSSSSIPKNMELATVLDPLHKHKSGKKLGKKSVSYHVSVPIEKSPLGHEMKVKIPRTIIRDPPSDTDTTSCFDSDGTYMRSECQSSDSGAMLLQNKKTKRNRSRDRELAEGGIIKTNTKKMSRKAKHIIRNSSDFFNKYDNRYWAIARSVCFWISISSMLGSIVICGILIALMPKVCDPDVEWWQGKLTLDIIPNNKIIDIVKVIQDIPRYKNIGVQTLKLKHLYLKNSSGDMDPENASSWLPLRTDVVSSWISSPTILPDLAKELHNQGMTLMVEIPAIQGNSTTAATMSYQLEREIMTAVVFWAQLGVDGISIIGLEQFHKDPYLVRNIETWKSKFQQYGISLNTKILCGPSLLPHNIDMVSPSKEGDEESPAFLGIQSFSLLDATVRLGTESFNAEITDSVSAATKWDSAPSQPWIHWVLQGEKKDLSNAELAFLMFLPGTVSLQDLRVEDEELVKKLASIRAQAVPVFMNGNYKTCHGHCTKYKEKEVNHHVHMKDNGLLLIERHFSRRHRFMVIANLGASNVSLSSLASTYTEGEIILDTVNIDEEEKYVDFNDAFLSGMQAYVIKFPK